MTTTTRKRGGGDDDEAVAQHKRLTNQMAEMQNPTAKGTRIPRFVSLIHKFHTYIPDSTQVPRVVVTRRRQNARNDKKACT